MWTCVPETVSGAQVTLQRYGADYLIEFECKVWPGARGETVLTKPRRSM